MKKAIVTILVLLLLGGTGAGIYFGVGVDKIKNLLHIEKEETPTEYKINYETDGLQTISVQYGEMFQLTSIPQKTGYTFAGLYDSPEGGTQVVGATGTSLSKYSFPGDTTLYAQWTPNVYHFVYSVEGKTYQAESSDSNSNLEYGKTIAFPPSKIITDKTHYSFVGWFTEPNGNGKQVADTEKMLAGCDTLSEQTYNLTTANHAITLYASFQPDTITIKLYPNVGDFSKSTTKTALYGTQFAIPNLYDDVGRLVESWGTDKNNPQASVFNGKLDGNVIGSEETELSLYAVPPVSVWINYNANGGSEVASVSVDSGTTLNLPQTTHSLGENVYHFTGWRDQNGKFYSNSIFISRTYKTITLTAVFEKAKPDYTYIATKEEFLAISNNLSGKYLLISDLNLGDNYTPIGSYFWEHQIKDDNPSKPFQGVFDGGGHTVSYKILIKEDYLNIKNDYAFGLFGTAKKAQFRNLTVTSSFATTGNVNKLQAREISVGGIVGFAQSSIFENCSTSSESNIANTDADSARHEFFSMFDRGATYAGGICGDARSCSFSSCHNYGKVFARGYSAYSGGITGNATVDCVFTDCLNSGNVTSSHGGWLSLVAPEDASGAIFGKQGQPWFRLDGKTYLNEN